MTEADRHLIDLIDLRARILDAARSDVHRAGGFPNGVAPTPQNILTVAEAYRDFILGQNKAEQPNIETTSAHQTGPV